MCAIAGAYGVANAAYVVSLMLKAMQHRGQEAAGIVSTDGARMHEHKGFGLIDEAFADLDFAKRLPGRAAVGHVRYSTSGDSADPSGIQPFSQRLWFDEVALVHNGNLTNYQETRRTLEEKGAIFRSSSDSELFLHLLQRERSSTEPLELLKKVCGRVQGAYSILVLTPRSLLAAVDPLGFRPLSWSKFGDGWLFASETCAFDLFDLDDGAPLPPREITEVHGAGIGGAFIGTEPGFTRRCSFEHIYFSRPDSNAFGISSNAVRRRLGATLARNHGIEADVVTAVPDSSNAIASAYAETAGLLPFRFALVRNHYTGRTFITPKQTARELGVRMKLNAVRDEVAGKRIVVVDDSLVRGTTAKKVAELLRAAGAAEVHMRIGSPPVIHPCFWGIDTPNRKELRAADAAPDELAAALGLDSLAYLTVDELRSALGDELGRTYCTTCFTGAPPESDVPIPLKVRKTEQR